MLRNRLLLGLLIAAAVAGPAAARAPRKHLSVSPTTAAPGALVHVSGNASPCLRGSTLTAISGAFPGHAFGEGTLTGTVGHAGHFAFSGHLRAHLRAGRYAVTARCGGGTLGIVAYLRIR
jgi:hypothetical protein